MAIDNDVLLRDGTVELNASEATPTAIDFGGPDLVPLTYFVDIVAATDGTDETLDVVIEGSNTSASAGFETIITFPQITALVSPGGQYAIEAISDLRWRRAKTTVGGSNTPSFHGCMIYCQPAGRYNKK